MKAEHLEHDIFLLMLNMSQLGDGDKIIQLFVDAINSLPTDFSLRLLNEGEDSQAETFSIATARNCFGCFAFEGDPPKPQSDFLALVRNSIRMLAIILENRLQAELFGDENIRLDRAVKERTSELELANQQLAANEQQLTAANQQLLSSEQQLRATNQQLTAHEQQLRAANEQLMASEERLRILFDQAADAIYVSKPNGQLIQVNEQACLSTGYTKEELLGFNVTDIDAEMTTPGAFSKFIDTLLPGRPATLQSRHRRIDGSTFPVEITISSLEMPGGRSIVGIARDITVRKRTEEALRNSEKKSRAWLECSPVCTKIVDLDFNLQYMSAAGIESLHIEDITQFYGKPFPFDFYPESVRRDMTGNLERVKETGEIITQEAPVFDTEGNEVWYHSTFVPVNDDEGQIDYIMVVSIDTTDRKRAEAALQESEKRMELALRGADLGTWDWNVQTGYVTFNERWAGMLGYALNEIEPHVSSWEKLVHPDDMPGIQKVLNAHLEGKTDFYETEQRLRHKSGKWVWVLTRGKVIDRDADGKPLRACGTDLDITERKRTEAALASEKLLSEEFINSLPGLFYVFDEQRFVRWNREWERITGYSDEELAGKYGTDFFEGEDKTLIRERMRKVFREGAADAEAELVLKDGQRIPYYFTGSRRKFNGKDYLVGLGIDITERKQAEKELAESESRFRELFQHMSSGVAVYEAADGGRDFVFKDFNQAGERIEKIKREDVVGRKVAEVFPGVEDFGFLEVFRRVWKTGNPEHFPISLYKDERISGWRENYVYKLPSGEIVAVYDDITERKKADEALLRSEEKFRGLVESSSDWIWEVNAEGLYTYASPQIEAILGYKPEEVVGKTPFALMPPEDAERIADIFNEIGAKGDPMVTLENVCLHKDGRRVVLETSGVPVRDEAGKVTGYRGVDRDISERKQAEQKILDDRKTLRSLALQLSSTEERERHRLATVLHDEIGQSLVFSKLRLDQLRASEPFCELSETLEEICTHLGQVIHKTRTLTFDLSYPILYELGFEVAVREWLVHEVGEKHGIETEFEDDGQLKPLDDDIRTLLFRNVRELLVNVVKHAQAQRVKISVHKADGAIHVSVEDDGVGFDPIEVGSMAAKGAKFGLFSIRARLEQLGGAIEVDSELGRGSKISMTAPLGKLEKIETADY